MAASSALFVASAGVGNHISGEIRQLGQFEARVFRTHTKVMHARCLCQLPRRTKKLKLKPSFAVRKDSDDSFLYNIEDTDEMFDDLFKKYGKVVYKRNDQKPPSAEVDDDADSLSFAVAMAKIASDVKAGDIKINAIATKIRDLAEEKYGKVPSGDAKPNSWTLLDFGDVVIHIFLPEQRDFYNLEEFYGNATSVELPFDNQPPFRN